MDSKSRLGELLFQLSVGEHREVGGDDGKLGVRADGFLESVAEALPSRVVEVLHGYLPFTSSSIMHSRMNAEKLVPLSAAALVTRKANVGIT